MQCQKQQMLACSVLGYWQFYDMLGLEWPHVVCKRTEDSHVDRGGVTEKVTASELKQPVVPCARPFTSKDMPVVLGSKPGVTRAGPFNVNVWCEVAFELERVPMQSPDVLTASQPLNPWDKECEKYLSSMPTALEKQSTSHVSRRATHQSNPMRWRTVYNRDFHMLRL